MSECSCTPCREPPVADCRWGSSMIGTQHARLCQKHSDELWEMIRGTVATGHSHYTIMPVGTFGEEIR